MKRKLELDNAHARDKRIHFDEPTHTYTVDGSKFKGSVSSFWGEFFDHFDAVPVINRCFHKWKSNRDEKYGYFILYMIAVQEVTKRDLIISIIKSMQEDNHFLENIMKKFPFLNKEHDFQYELKKNESDLGDKGYYWLIRYLSCVQGLQDSEIKTEISRMWTTLGTRASSDGTYMHLQLELKNNDEEYDVGMHEVKLYNKFIQERPWLKPYRTEWSVFSTEAHLAGQIDLVVQDTRFNPPKYYIIDFKRCKDLLTPSNPYNKFGKVPFHQVPDTAYGHYSVQQGAYRWFLETLYGIKISKCYLLQLHPTMNEYNFVRLPNLRESINIAINQRIKNLRMKT